MTRYEPLFSGLIYNEEGEPVQTTSVGEEACYAIPEGDFLRHIEAIEVDRQIVHQLKERFMAIKDVLIEGMMHMIGSDDPFSRAAIVQGLENMERILDMGGAVTEDMRIGLWMTGFRATVDLHGDVVHLEIPGLEKPEV